MSKAKKKPLLQARLCPVSGVAEKECALAAGCNTKRGLRCREPGGSLWADRHLTPAAEWR